MEPKQPLKPICSGREVSDRCAYYRETNTTSGHCRKNNPPEKKHTIPRATMNAIEVPSYYWCGEHHLFKKYLSELKEYNELLKKVKKGI